MSTIGPIQNIAPALFSPAGTGAASLAKETLAQNPQGVSLAGLANPAQSADAAQPASFTNILRNAVGQVDGKMRAASVEQEKLLTGETSNLHQSVIAMQEASLSFSLMVEVRNKLVDSYQELMKMQV
jgi:flagellar hook-basal body complex protein FliE